MRRLIIYLFLAVSSILAQNDAKPEPTHNDVGYGPHERHKLDLWSAQSDASTPLLIFIHGGGWGGGDKKDIPPNLIKTMLSHGISVASINYRYSTIAPLPAPVHDAARAVQFLRSKATKWKLNPQRFGAYGISAGGCTTLWLACHDDLANPQSKDPINQHSTRLQVAVGMSPQTSLEPEVVTDWVGGQVLLHPMISRAVAGKKLEAMNSPSKEWLKLLREFSPIIHLSKDDPPMLLSYPRIDPLPATTPGSAIHHALFGSKFKERSDAMGLPCLLRIQEKEDPNIPTPEEFMIQQLGK